MDVSWRDSWSVSLSVRRVRVRSDVWPRRVWRERSGSMDAAVVWLCVDRTDEADCGLREVVLGFVCWVGKGRGRFGRRPSSIKGMRSSMDSVDIRGKWEKRRGCINVCNARVWCVRCDVMDV